MGIATSSAARLSDAASDDPLAGIEPANDAYGSLAGLASRPKPKKKPVLVLDADELAAAHELFQLGAAEQLEDADQIERAPVRLSLAPLGSDAEADDTPDEDDDDYALEADAPAPDDVLNLTRMDVPDEPKPRKNPNKTMVALPPDGDPELDAIEPFVPLAPIDEEDVGDAEELSLPLTEVDASDPALPEESTTQPLSDEDGPAEVADAQDLPPEESDAPPEPEFSLDDESFIRHPVDKVSAPAPPAEPETVSHAEPEAAQDAAAQERRITRIEEEEVDGSAFMRGPERRPIDIASAVGPTSQNSLRARLVREEDIVIEEEPEGMWARFTTWLGDLWRKFLG